MLRPRKKAVWAGSCLQAKEKPALIRDFRLQNGEKINVCCLSWPISGIFVKVTRADTHEGSALARPCFLILDQAHTPHCGQRPPDHRIQVAPPVLLSGLP